MIRKRRLAILALGAFALPATVLAMQSGTGEAFQIFRTHEQSAVQIYDIGGTPAKLDTATGAVFSLRGNAGTRGTGGYWWLNVPAVNTAGTGMFEIQRADDSVFLVDIQDGTTWLLRWRGNQNGAWQALPNQR
ncbi:MAG: hypothetical protein ACYTGP_08815 [Planctomycetota bacterium]|jgi:hypothetical protein